MSCDAQDFKLSNCNSNTCPLILMSSGLLKESILHIQASFQPICVMYVAKWIYWIIWDFCIWQTFPVLRNRARLDAIMNQWTRFQFSVSRIIIIYPLIEKRSNESQMNSCEWCFVQCRRRCSRNGKEIIWKSAIRLLNLKLFQFGVNNLQFKSVTFFRFFIRENRSN